MLSMFEGWQVLRVTLKTDARNTASRRAVERLGALRRACAARTRSPLMGRVRDSAYYSVTTVEWPAVRAGLQRRLTGAGT